MLIVDDEPVARAGVRKLVQHDPDITVVGEARDGAEAISLIAELQPDLVFLDIQMPELNGFDVLEAVGADRAPIVVFVTAYDQFALRAFEAQALDYILKPFDDERFRAALARAKDQVRRSRSADLTDKLEALLSAYATQSRAPAQGARPGYLTRIIVRDSGTVTFQPVDTLDWIEAADYYAKLHIGDAVQLVRYTMNELEHQLDPRRFVRVHRSAIVNISRVKEIRVDYQNHHLVVLKNGTRIPLSRSRRDLLEDVLSKGA